MHSDDYSSVVDIHVEQHRIWEAEHSKPFMFPFVDSIVPTDAVVFFGKWLSNNIDDLGNLRGIEMCCGKGRNSIWLAGLGVQMTGFDFSSHAILEAKKRSDLANLSHYTKFLVHDAVSEWPFANSSFDFFIDCFGSSDIETKSGRIMARNEALRVVKPGGYQYMLPATMSK